MDVVLEAPPIGSPTAAQLLDFFETATIGLHAVAADGTILWANEADHRLLGYAKGEYVGHNVAEFHADPENLAAILGCLTRGERVANRKAVLRAKDGTLRHVLIDSSGYFEDGKFVHTRCFTRDVTHVTEQTALHEAMVRAQSELGDGVVVCDDERVHWANDAYCALVGFSREEVLSPGFRLRDRLAPQGLPAAEQRVRERGAGQALQHRFDATLVRKDGSHVECDISVKALSLGPNPRRICIVRDITARREAERAVREQRDLYEALLRAESDLGQGVLLTKAETVEYANEAFARLLGKTVAEVLAPGFDARPILAPGGAGRPPGASGLPDPHVAAHYEVALARADGRTACVEVASVGVDLAGEPRRLALVRDVTRLREDETRLKRNDEFLTRATLSIIENALDPDETMRLVARLAVERLADAANVDVLQGESGLDRVVIAHRDPAKQPLVDELRARFPPHPAVRRLIESIPAGAARVTNDIPPERVQDYVSHPEELRLAREVGYRHALLVPLRGRAGLLGSLTLTRGSGEGFTGQDVFLAKSLAARAALAYENAKLHAATRRLEAEWRSLSERYQRILDTAPAQVITIDEEGTILSLNRSVRGMDPRRALGLNALDTVVEADRERVKGILLDAMRTGKPAEYETQALLAPGAARWFNVRVGPVEIDGRRGAVLVSTDVEEKKRAERELADMRVQLIQGEKLSALGSLVSGVAHELRTPLTFLANNAFLLKRRLDEAARRGDMAPGERASADRFLDEITAGVDRINQLVEDLRRYTKARHDARFDVAPLDEAVADAVELFRATNRSVHRLEPRLARTAPVRVNAGSVQQIVLNLLQNAADATPRGGVIGVRTLDEDEGVLLEVSDEGSGIPRDVQERMFEPLFTTKADGTGLGLSIVRRIVEEHRAAIEWETALGRGTTFRLRFPRA